MNKIETFRLHNFRNNEHFQFMIDFNKLILFYQASELGISKVYPLFRDALNAEDIALRIELGSTKSKMIEVLDQNLLNERNTELAGRESGDVHAIRLQIDPIYEQIVEKINATVVIEIARPAAISFVSELNTKIKYYKTTLASLNRQSKPVEESVGKV